MAGKGGAQTARAAVIALQEIEAAAGPSVPPFKGHKPRSKLQLDWCREYIKDRSPKHAALRAGYGQEWAERQAYLMVSKFEGFIQWLEAIQAKANAKQIAIELEPVLQEIARIALVNEYDYLVFTPGTAPDQPPQVRRKRLDELTREQMTAIKILKRKKGELDYVLRDKEGRLIDLMRHLGGFNETIILEHRHRHLHAHVDLTNVPLDQLEHMESEMEKLLNGRTRGTALKVN